MTKVSVEFEQLIADIEKVLREDKVNVTWNETIKDPDSPNQTRQIDISIKENNYTTHIECRIHSKPQNVKWVEELIGRKISLKVDDMIGVSSSGFTEPAIRKAKNHGIILRDLRAISKEELYSWGKAFKATVEYMKFDNIIFELCTENEIQDLFVTIDEFRFALQGHPNAIQLLLRPLDDIVRERVDKNEIFKDGRMQIEYNFDLYSKLFLKGIHIHRIKVSVPDYRPLRVVSFVSEVALYGMPSNSENEEIASVQKISEQKWQLIDTAKRGKFTLDLASLQPPPNAILCGLKFSNLTPGKRYEIMFNNLTPEDYYDKLENTTIVIINEK